MGIFDKLFGKKAAEEVSAPIVEPKAPEVPKPAAKPEEPKIERVSAADYIHDEAPAKKPRTRKAAVCITTDSGYEYKNVGVYRPKNAKLAEMPIIDQEIFFEQDPTNPYDDHAVKAICYDFLGNPGVAGYLNRGRLKDMIWDWLDNDWEYEAVVTRADDKLEISLIMTRG